MKESAVQKELFEEYRTPKDKAKRRQTILPRSFKPLSVSYEQAVFMAIAAIMLMVLVFSLGVERGKRLAGAAAPKKDAPDKQASDKEYKTSAAVKEDVAVAQQDTKRPAPLPEKEKKAVKSDLFTIQVIAYRSKKSAQRELERLSEKGYKPFIITGGGYYQVCVGEYANKDESKNDFLELKKSYKDSFIRKR